MSLFDLFFGPLPINKNYCQYFQYMSIITPFIMFLIPLKALFFHKSTKSLMTFIKVISFLIMLAPLLILSFFAYFNNRLLYTLCLKNIL